MKTTEYYNSTKNQGIKRDFVQREVLANVNSMVRYILGKSYYGETETPPFSHDDIENYYQYPKYIGDYANFEGGTEDQRQKEIERLRELIADDDHDTEMRDTIESEIDDIENLESEHREVYEWWMVSGYLFDKLKEKGEVVIESEGIWGRRSTGQAVSLDHVISEICEDMEILVG